MSNLIITVISIALVAVAALMGAYYGGTAFMDGQDKAKANQILAQAEQIKTAYLLYLSNGKPSVPSPTNIDGSDPLTTQFYLSTTPQPSQSILPSSTTYWQITFLYPYAALTGTTLSDPPRTNITINNLSVCQKINQIVNGSPELGIYKNYSGGDVTWDVVKDSQGRGFLTRLITFGADCTLVDNNANGAFDTGESLIFSKLIRR